MPEFFKVFSYANRRFVLFGAVLILVGIAYQFYPFFIKEKVITQEPTKTNSNNTANVVSSNNNTQQSNKHIQSTPKLIADYFVTSQNTNEVDGLLSQVQSLIENNGHSVFVGEYDGSPISNLKGSYKKAVFISSTKDTHTTSIDDNLKTTNYTYSIKVYDIATGKLIKNISDNGGLAGSSERINIGNILEQITPKIKSQL